MHFDKQARPYFILISILVLLFAACGDSGNGGDKKSPTSAIEGGVDTIEDLPNCSKAREGDSASVGKDSLVYICHNGKWSPVETETDPSSSSAKDSLQKSHADGVETIDDLPNCSKNREGDSVFVAEDSSTYICRSGKWEEKKYLIDSVETEDDLPACTKSHEGDSAYVSGEYAVFVCSGNVWKKDQSIIQVYKSADDMPNCTKKLDNVEAVSTSDSALFLCDGERWQEMATTYASAETLPNCTEKREGNQAFLLDTREKFQCIGKQWKSIEEWSDAPGSSASQSSSSKGLSASSNLIEYGALPDSRDGQTYKTVVIGSQTWMAENLNYDDGYGVCPMKETENCVKYGRLYKFNGKDGSNQSDICPTGWRLPDSLDYAELIAYVSKNNGGEAVGVSLKATTDWISAGETVTIEGDGNVYGGSLDSTRVGATRGTDRFGFAALPAGSCWGKGTTTGEHCYTGDDTRFFFSTPLEGGSYKLAFDKDSLIYDKDGGWGYISVRCLKGVASSSSESSASSSPSSNGSSSGIAFGSLKDTRNGKTYKTVTIDIPSKNYSEEWMAENMNLETTNSWCGGGSGTTEGDCSVYGRLYTWTAATHVCPEGWHLPTKAEWENLFAAVALGGQSIAGAKLKAQTGWSGSGNGTDAYGFSALPAGVRYNSEVFSDTGLSAYFWSATKNASSSVLFYGIFLNGSDSVKLDSYVEDFAYSVRCLKG